MNIKNDVSIKYMIVAMLTLFYVSFCVIFFHMQYDNVQEVMKEYLYDARLEILNETYTDDNLSLALSYLNQQRNPRSAKSDCYFPLEYNSALNVWGINVDKRQGLANLYGTLQSKNKQISCETLNFLHLFDEIYQFRRDERESHNQLVYFIPKDRAYIYFSTPVFNKNYTESNIFKNIDYFHTKDFLSLMKNKTLSWTYNVRTDIYDDFNTGEKVISVGSIVYNFNDAQGVDIIGYVFKDFVQDDLKRIIYDRIKPEWRNHVKMIVRDRLKNSEMTYGVSRLFSTNVRLNFSHKYEVSYAYPVSIILIDNITTFLISFVVYILVLLLMLYIYRMMVVFKGDSYADPLTGCYNRRYLELYTTNSRLSDKRVGVLVLDCNNFKTINDQLGHDSGDRALVFLAQTLVKVFRKNKDKLIRLGGDEFCVLILDPDNIEIEKVIARINNKLREFDSDIIFSVSWGYHVSAGANIIEALRSADMKQYENKESMKKQA